MALIDPPLFLQSDAHPARIFRQLITATFAEGTLGSTSFAVSQRSSGGANFSVDVAAGMAVVTGDSAAQQGRYLVVNDATVNDASTIVTSAPSAGNTRYDIVVLEVKDHAEDAGGINAPRFRVVAGTPATSGAVPPAVPNTCLLLATIGPIINGTASITNSLIVDGRVASRLANQVVNTAAIADANVTTAKIADSAVTTGKIADGTIGLGDLNPAVYSVLNTPNTLVQRFSDGRFEGATPAGNNDVATAGWVLGGAFSSAWGVLSFNSGWSGTAKFKRIGNAGFLTITAAKTGAAGTTLGVVPAGFRPPASLSFPATDGGTGLETSFTLATDGTLSLSQGNAGTYGASLVYEAA